MNSWSVSYKLCTNNLKFKLFITSSGLQDHCHRAEFRSQQKGAWEARIRDVSRAPQDRASSQRIPGKVEDSSEAHHSLRGRQCVTCNGKLLKKNFPNTLLFYLFLKSVSLNLRKFNLIAGQPKTDAALTVSSETPPTFSIHT